MAGIITTVVTVATATTTLHEWRYYKNAAHSIAYVTWVVTGIPAIATATTAFNQFRCRHSDASPLNCSFASDHYSIDPRTGYNFRRSSPLTNPRVVNFLQGKSLIQIPDRFAGCNEEQPGEEQSDRHPDHRLLHTNVIYEPAHRERG